MNFGKQDLSVADARKLSDKLGAIASLDIGGGEPFMHADLFGVVAQFRFRNITIPTNGFYQENILKVTGELLRAYPGRVTIAVSIDGPQELNDALRGPRSYERARATFDALRALRGLKVKVNTVVSDRNLESLLEFTREIRSWDPDYHSLLLLRGDPLAPDEIATPAPAALRALTPALFEVLSSYGFGAPRPAAWLFRSYQRYLWETSLRIIETRRAPFQCRAPHFNKVIYSDGQASMCELKPRMGNLLTEERGALEPRFHAHLADFERQHGRCFCTHNCVMSENIATHVPSALCVATGNVGR